MRVLATSMTSTAYRFPGPRSPVLAGRIAASESTDSIMASGLVLLEEDFRGPWRCGGPGIETSFTGGGQGNLGSGSPVLLESLIFLPSPHH